MYYTIPVKSPFSHKGESGIATIVAGSPKYYGAPILTALGAESAGTDLIHLHLPQSQLDAARNYSLNFFLKPFVAETVLGLKDIGLVLDDVKKSKVLIIGPGLGTDDDTRRAILYILSESEVPCVIDAEALFSDILSVKRKSEWIVTPHKGEFMRLFNIDATEGSVRIMAAKHGLTILCKGQVDFIVSHEEVYNNKTGCAAMRVMCLRA
jgi:hydroxyethylthiazole kinase-like uncharacterized protein yjeF